MDRTQIFHPGNVAVITGAALGIGRSMALKFAKAGMSVAMSDLDSPHFDEAIEAVQNAAGDNKNNILAITTDVADIEQIEKLKTEILGRFGKVNFLANNAASRTGRGHDADIMEWHQVMEVNLWGPVYGVRAFLPGMLEGEEQCAIVNVGSKQGITNPPGHPIYNMSKSALKTYTEALQHELRNTPANDDNRVSAHLLVPGWTTTGTNEHKQGAWLPEQVVDLMIERVSQNDFYIICPDDEVTTDMDNKRILWGAQDITENRPPLSRWHPDFAEAAKQL